jgi:hypothetical protein
LLRPTRKVASLAHALVAHGVIHYPMKELGLCASVSGARYTTTTEVYPDSPRASPEQCIAAQVAAVDCGIAVCMRKLPLAHSYQSLCAIKAELTCCWVAFV